MKKNDLVFVGCFLLVLEGSFHEGKGPTFYSLIVTGQGALSQKRGDSGYMLEINFLLRTVRHLHRLPRLAVDIPSLKAFKAGLNGQPDLMSGNQNTGGGWNWMGFKVPSKLSHSMTL